MTAKTRFEGIAGFGALKVGQRGIEIKTRKRVNRAWVAIKVERSGEGANHNDGAGHDVGDDHGTDD